MTKLTDHFSLRELTRSRDGEAAGLVNTPNATQEANLNKLAIALERVRKLLGGKEIIVNSGYRSPAVNKLVGGVATSAHLYGYAADFWCPSYGTPLEICRAIVKDGTIKFDQLIEEGTWVHISIDPRLRGQVKTMRNGRYYMGLDI